MPVVCNSGAYSEYATIKYSTDAQLQWLATYRPANAFAVPFAPALDAAGYVYLTGNVGNISGSMATDLNVDFLTVKYNAGGVRQWAVTYDGPPGGDDYARDVALDSGGNVYVTGPSQRVNVVFQQDYAYATIKYDASGVQQWAVRFDDLGSNNHWATGDEGLAVHFAVAGGVYITGTRLPPEVPGSPASQNYDIVTIKYQEEQLIGEVFRWQDRFEIMKIICFDVPQRWPSRGDLPIPFIGPSCPPPPGCIRCSFSANWNPGEMPSYLSEIYRTLHVSVGPTVGIHFPKGAQERLAADFKKARLGLAFDASLKSAVLQSLGRPLDDKRLPPEGAGKVLEAVNALDLDWRAPKNLAAKVKKGRYSSVDIRGVAKLKMRNVTKAGTVKLRIGNGLPAMVAGYEPGWPLATFDFAFSGEIGASGYFDVIVYMGGISFEEPLSAVRVLQWNGKSYEDITSHVDEKRLTVSGRTSKLLPIVLMTRATGFNTSLTNKP